MNEIKSNAPSNVILIDRLSDTVRYRVKSNTKYTFIIFLEGNHDAQGKVEIEIEGSNADVKILGLLLGTGTSRLRLYTLQNHHKPSSVSDLLIKSVLFGKSKLYYEGLIKIGSGAQKSNAYQKNQVLLMSKDVWADSRPKLEILANDVRCTHGATIGKIDRELLFYLSTRGLNEKKASQLIISGFYQEVLDRIPDRNLSEKLSLRLDSLVVKYL